MRKVGRKQVTAMHLSRYEDDEQEMRYSQYHCLLNPCYTGYLACGGGRPPSLSGSSAEEGHRFVFSM